MTIQIKVVNQVVQNIFNQLRDKQVSFKFVSELNIFEIFGQNFSLPPDSVTYLLTANGQVLEIHKDNIQSFVVYY